MSRVSPGPVKANLVRLTLGLNDSELRTLPLVGSSIVRFAFDVLIFKPHMAQCPNTKSGCCVLGDMPVKVMMYCMRISVTR